MDLLRLSVRSRSQQQVSLLLMKGLTLVDAIDVKMERSAGFAHQPYVISLLKGG